MKLSVILLPLAFLLAGCAVGNQYDYRQSVMVMPVKGESAIGLIISDQRPYVLSGERKPNFIGIQRGGYGNPFNVTTASGSPLTKDMEEAVASGLKKNGYSVGIVEQSSVPTAESVASAAQRSGFAKVVALLVRDWRTDIYMAMTLHYDLEAIIYGADGGILARNRMAAVEEVGGAALGAEGNSRTAQAAFSQKISYLFYHPDIKKALAN